MQSHSRIVLFCLFVLFVGEIYAKDISYDDSTRLLLVALDMKNHNDTKNSLGVFEHLFSKKKKYIYLDNIIQLNMKLRRYHTVIALTHRYATIYPNHEQTIYQQRVKALVYTDRYKRAIDTQKYIIKYYHSQFNLFNLSKIHYRQKEFENAQKYAIEALSIKSNNKIAVYYTNMLYNDMNQTTKAKQYLEYYIQTHKPSYDLYVAMAKIYIKNNNISHTIDMTKKLYMLTKQRNTTYKYIDEFATKILRYMDTTQKLDMVKFLKSQEIQTDMLLSLYLDVGELNKAQALTKELYMETKKLRYYAQNSMLQYELATNKNDVLDEVISEFNYIISKDKHSRYLNFLGYLLIDHDVDIKRGLKLAKQAVKKSPQNIAYKDSLAWGYYKQSQCDKAKMVMYNILSDKTISDKTILEHNRKIRRCK